MRSSDWSSDVCSSDLLVIKNFRGRKSGEYLDPQPFRLLGEPAAQIAEAAGIGALVVHETGRDEFGQAELLCLGQYPVLVVVDRHFGQRTPLIAPVGDQFVERSRVDDRSRQDV